uniref:SGS domain-containing protein n=1 Tax=Rhabditophanes sp. KR3021 TaxID=114890 RepID=A0AC35TJ51_9BILA
MAKDLPRYEWYQTDKQVTIAISKADTDIKDVSFKYGRDHNILQIYVGFELIFDGKLSNGIDDRNLTLTCTKRKVEAKCPKVENKQWSALFSDGKKEIAKTIVVTPEKIVQKEKKNWLQIGKEADEEEVKDMEGSEAGLNHFFQKLYGDSNEETKKAMMKSFSESNGTVLSTDWNDVKKKKIECQPPDNMEFKKY